MELWFKGISQSREIVYYNIDRKLKKLIFASSRTKFNKKELPWKMLFDEGRERVQENITNKMNDNQFAMCVISNMMKVGYKRIDKDGNDNRRTNIQ